MVVDDEVLETPTSKVLFFLFLPIFPLFLFEGLSIKVGKCIGMVKGIHNRK